MALKLINKIRGNSRTEVATISIPSNQEQVQSALPSGRGHRSGMNVCLEVPVSNFEKTVSWPANVKQIQEETEALRKENMTLLNQLQDALAKIQERDKAILKLQTSVEDIQKERLQEEEIRYQRGIVIKNQQIHELKEELQKLKFAIDETKTTAARKVQKAKKRIAETKQDNALKVFELKEENARLIEENERLIGEARIKETERHTCQAINPISNSASSTSILSQDSGILENVNKSKLILELSEQISQLAEENDMLKEELTKVKAETRKLQ